MDMWDMDCVTEVRTVTPQNQFSSKFVIYSDGKHKSAVTGRSLRSYKHKAYCLVESWTTRDSFWIWSTQERSKGRREEGGKAKIKLFVFESCMWLWQLKMSGPGRITYINYKRYSRITSSQNSSFSADYTNPRKVDKFTGPENCLGMQRNEVWQTIVSHRDSGEFWSC